MRKALILTNHMADISGSEIVVLEIAEVLSTWGYEVHLHCNYLADPMATLLVKAEVFASDADVFPDAFKYDLVWFQHHVISLALNSHPIPDHWETCFISSHLSPFEPLELTGVNIAQHLGSVIVANSHETAQRLNELGVPIASIHVSYNSCPSIFYNAELILKNQLTQLLIVSNHPPNEVLEAVQLLEKIGVNCRHIGLSGEYHRITPADISWADGVICIGKTTQYSILGGRPVYCYDQFGGPGWLNENNFQSAEWFNFSGRSDTTKKNAIRIVDEILIGFGMARDFISHIQPERRDRYSLEKFLSNIIPTLHPENRDDHPRTTLGCRTERLCHFVATEASLSLALRRHYRNEREMRKRVEFCESYNVRLSEDLLTSRVEIKNLQHEITNLHETIKTKEHDLQIQNETIESYNKALQDIFQSRSWRYTAPLRYLVDKFR